MVWFTIKLYKPGNSRHFMEMVLMYVVASISYFRTLVSIPSWDTSRTKKGLSSPFLGFFNFSITYKKTNTGFSVHTRLLVNKAFVCRTLYENKNHLLDFKIEQHVDNILSESTVGQCRLTPCTHWKCLNQSFIYNRFIYRRQQGQIKPLMLNLSVSPGFCRIFFWIL